MGHKPHSQGVSRGHPGRVGPLQRVSLDTVRQKTTPLCAEGKDGGLWAWWAGKPVGLGEKESHYCMRDFEHDPEKKSEAQRWSSLAGFHGFALIDHMAMGVTQQPLLLYQNTG